MNQTDIDKFIKEYKDNQQIFINEANKTLLVLLESFWEMNPTIKLITWAQYTPYFNDGDECTFGLTEILLSNIVEKEDIKYLSDCDYYGYNPDLWAVTTSNYNKCFEQYKINEDSVKLLESFIETLADLNILRQMFGEDSKVLITRDGITIEDYSNQHD